jgi:hypothetical protein
MPSRAIPPAPFGYAGAALVALGGALPFVSLPLVGGVAAGALVPRSGVLLLAVGVFAAGLLRAGRAGWTWTAGLAALAVAGWTLGAINPVTAEAGLVLDAGRIGARRAAVALLTGEIGWGAGLAAVAAGALLLLVASGLHATRPRLDGGVSADPATASGGGGTVRGG